MKIITANELISGASVYLLRNGEWGTDIQRAQHFSDRQEQDCADALTQARRSGRLISVESEIVNRSGGKTIAFRLRERIRAEGPTAPRQQPQNYTEVLRLGGRNVSL